VSGYGKPLTPAGSASVGDAEIDFDEIPEMNADFWQETGLAAPERAERISAGAADIRGIIRPPRAQSVILFSGGRGPLNA